jgi:hypothetical protein
VYFVINGRTIRNLWWVAAVYIAAQGVSFVATAAQEKVDLKKKSSYSTSGAMRPTEMKFKKAPINTSKSVKTPDVPIKRARLSGDGKKISVEEARKKQIITPQTRSMEVMTFDSKTAVSLPASIPRIRREDFQKLVREYEQGRVPSNPFENAQVMIGGEMVGIGDINRYANPRSALEAQGIPVTRAATDEDKPKDAPKRSVAIPGVLEPGE